MSSQLGALVGALVGGALCLAVPWLVARTSEVPRGRRLLPGAVLAGMSFGVVLLLRAARPRLFGG